MRVSPIRHGWARRKFAKDKIGTFGKLGFLASRSEGLKLLAPPHVPRAKGEPIGNLGEGVLARIFGFQRLRAAPPCLARMPDSGRQVFSQDEYRFYDDVPHDDQADKIVPSIKLESSFFSKNREMWLIVLRNTLLIILTLTLYRFWARTRVRNYLWSRIQIAGEPLEYTGRTIELLLGFVLIIVILVIPLVLISISMQLFIRPDDPIFILYAFALYLGVFFLYGVARYRAQRYRLSRTLWRGIRFGLRGSWISFGLRTLGLSYLTFFSLFLAYPAERFILMKQLMSNMTFGDRQFAFEGSIGKLYPSFLLAWMLSIVGLFAAFTVISGAIVNVIQAGEFPVAIDRDQLEAGVVQPELFALILIATVLFYALLGLILSITTAWYHAKEFRYFAQCTTLDGMQFKLEAGGIAVMRLTFGNALIVLFTLGFGLPLAQMRTFRFLFTRLQGDGPLDIDSIGPGDAPYPWVGEGLAEFFEIGSV